MRKIFCCAGIVLLICGVCHAQSAKAGMPDSLVIARETFWDFGPPFNYYDLIQIKRRNEGLAVEQVLVTPPGQACMQPAKVEDRSVVLHESMEELLAGRNPCAIPEKELHREVKRCRKCLVFSGVYVAMQASCSGKDRQLRMDILDRDIYDSRTQTPANTSWTMLLLSRLNDSLGPGSEAEPMFKVEVAVRKPVPNSPLIGQIVGGNFDQLFGPQVEVSKIAQEASRPLPPPPSVEIESAAPFAPVSPVLPIYPPIAKAARVEGLVNVTFDVDMEGKAQNVAFADEGRLKMIEMGVKDAVMQWSFPKEAWGRSGRASIRFNLNCHAGSS
jgi:hypothetical protein